MYEHTTLISIKSLPRKLKKKSGQITFNFSILSIRSNISPKRYYRNRS